MKIRILISNCLLCGNSEYKKIQKISSATLLKLNFKNYFQKEFLVCFAAALG